MRTFYKTGRKSRIFVIIAVAVFLFSAFCIVPVSSESDAVESGSWDGYSDWTCTITNSGSGPGSVSYKIGDGDAKTTSLASYGTVDSFWNFDTTTGYGPFNSFYAAFDDDGKFVCHLNPYNLTSSLDGALTISNTSYDIMWCIPTVYITTDEGTLILSSTGEDSAALAHLIDGKVWKYLGIGVYEGEVSNGKLYSHATKPSLSSSLSDYQTYAAAKIVDMDGDGINDGDSIVWNYYQWLLYRYVTLAVVRSFDVQTVFGVGNTESTEGVVTQGTSLSINTPYYGTYDASMAGVKLFIENAWGNAADYIGDACLLNGLYAGHNGDAQVAYFSTMFDENTLEMTSVTAGLEGYGASWGASRKVDSWGLPTYKESAWSVNDPDYIYTKGTGGNVAVGGTPGSATNAGINCINGLFYKVYGFAAARLAFVFDFDPTTCTIIFDGNGGIPAITSAIGQTTLPSATLDHYEFTGWYTAASEGTLIGSAGDTYTPTANITLYAHWKASTYSVVFIDRGSTVQTQTVTIGESCVSPVRSWLGYSILGWSASTDTKTAEYPVSGFTPETDLTLYAVWTRTVTLSYDANGGTDAPASQKSTWTGAASVNSNNFAPDPSTMTIWGNASIDATETAVTGHSLKCPTGNGLTGAYVYAGKSPESGHIYYSQTYCKTDGSTSGTTNIIFTEWVCYADSKWNLCASSSTYSAVDYSDWTIISSRGTASTIPDGVGWRFDQYATSPATTIWFDGFLYVDLTAIYGVGNEPSLAWCDAHIGYYNADYGATFTVTPMEPTRENYRFLGWSTDRNATASTYDSSDSISVTGDTKLYAVWELITWDVSFNSNLGSTVSTQTITNGQSAVAPTNPTLEGYSFQGWYTDKGLTTAYDFSTAVTSDITLYAKWVGILAFTTVPTVSTNFASVAPSTYTFSAVGSYGSSFHWDFGDGQSADGIYATHWYERDGDYTVTLTAYNAYGESATDTFTVSTGSGDAGSDHHDDDHTLALAALGVVGAIVLVSVVRRFV